MFPTVQCVLSNYALLCLSFCMCVQAYVSFGDGEGADNSSVQDEGEEQVIQHTEHGGDHEEPVCCRVTLRCAVHCTCCVIAACTNTSQPPTTFASRYLHLTPCTLHLWLPSTR